MFEERTTYVDDGDLGSHCDDWVLGYLIDCVAAFATDGDDGLSGRERRSGLREDDQSEEEVRGGSRGALIFWSY